MTHPVLSAGIDPAAALRVAIAGGPAGDCVVAIVPSDGDPLGLAYARAAVEAVAVERAPAVRINAVVVDLTAPAAAVAAAIAYLAGAASVTGQWLVVGCCSR